VRVQDGRITAVMRSNVRNTGWISELSFSRDGQWLASAGWDSRVVLWQVHDGAPLHSLEGDRERQRELVQRVNRKELSPQEQQRQSVLLGHTGNLTSVAVHPSGRWLASLNFLGSLWLWSSEEASPRTLAR
jgi:WD40 repeat protein